MREKVKDVEWLHTCDRCKTSMTYNGLTTLFRSRWGRASGIDYYSFADLCDSCWKDFNLFLKNPRSMVSKDAPTNLPETIDTITTISDPDRTSKYQLEVQGPVSYKGPAPFLGVLGIR